MHEIRLLHLPAVSFYRRDEPDLPGEVHNRRALGGPPVSVLLVLAGLLAALLPAEGSVWCGDGRTEPNSAHNLNAAATTSISFTAAA
jgi:hypothetical protein